MEHWTAWNWINMFFTVLSGWVAIDCFKNGSVFLGWSNLIASSMNGAAVAARLV